MAYNALSGTIVANRNPVFHPGTIGGEHTNAIEGEFYGDGLHLKNVARVVANDVNDYVVTLGNQEQSLVGEPNLRFNGNRLYVNAPVTASALQLRSLDHVDNPENTTLLAIDENGNVFKSSPTPTSGPIYSLQFEGNNNSISGSSNLTYNPNLNEMFLTGNFVVSGAIKAESFDVISTSIIEINSTGSTNFGNDVGDTHNLVGSLAVGDGDAEIFSVQSSESIIKMNSGVVRKRHFTSEDYQILKTDYIIGVSSVEQPVTIQLPDASTLQSGHTFVIKDEGGNAFNNNITVVTQVGQFVNNTNQAILQVPYSSFSVYCDGDKKFFSY